MATDGSSGRSALRLGLELLALSFVALFFELMVIRWAPAVVRLVAYYANLMLISSFLGLGVGAAMGHARRSIYGWMPLLVVLDVGVLLLAQHVSMPTSGGEFRFYRESAGLLNYVMLIAIFACNAAVFVPLGQRIGTLFNALPPLSAYGWDLGGTLLFGAFSLTWFSPVLGMVLVIGVLLALLPRAQWLRALPLYALALVGVWLSSRDRDCAHCRGLLRLRRRQQSRAAGLPSGLARLSAMSPRDGLPDAICRGVRGLPATGRAA